MARQRAAAAKEAPQAEQLEAAAAEPAEAEPDAEPETSEQPEEPETVEGEAVEEDEDPRPTLTEYEAARGVLSDASTEGSEEGVIAQRIVDAAVEHGIRPPIQEAGTAVQTLPAIREAMETTDVERRSALPPTTVLPSPKEWEAALAMATEIANTKFVPSDLRNRPEEVLACILSGREIGIGPMEALRKIHMIDGRPAFAADLMLSLMRKGGVRIVASESTADRAWIRAKRNDTGEEAEVEWTMAEASTITTKGKRLVDKDNWTNYPADMLWARCVGRLARRLASDLLGGMSYSAEEVQDFDDYEGSYASGKGKPAGAQTTSDQRGWQPDTHLLPGAIPLDGEYWQRVKQQLDWIDNQCDWSQVFTQAAQKIWPELAEWKALEGDDYKRFAVRLSNALQKITDLSQGADLISEQHIIDGFAFAFAAVQVKLPRVGEQPPAGEPADDEEPVTEAQDADGAPAAEPAAEDAEPAEPGQLAAEDVPFGE